MLFWVNQKYAKFKESTCTIQNPVNCEGYNKCFWGAHATISQYYILLLEFQDSSNLALQDGKRSLAERHVDEARYLRASFSEIYLTFNEKNYIKIVTGLKNVLL